jgi:hypothetical protein
MARPRDSKGPIVESARFPNSGRARLSPVHERRQLQPPPFDTLSRGASSIQLKGPLGGTGRITASMTMSPNRALWNSLGAWFERPDYALNRSSIASSNCRKFQPSK